MINSDIQLRFLAPGLTPAPSLLVTPLRTRTALLAAALMSLAAATANAQWSVTVLRQPSLSEFSYANCVWGNRQAGGFDDGYATPLIWQGAPNPFVYAAEPGVDSGSRINGISATNLVGEGYVRLTPESGFYAALLWNAAGDQVTLLTVPGANAASANGVSGDTQVGRAEYENVSAPVLWRGTSESAVNLMPPGGIGGEARGVDGDQQVGYVYFGQDDVASLWTGTAESWVSLHPSGWEGSSIESVSQGKQVGSVYRVEGGDTYVNHAAVWSGTAGSMIDNKPLNASTSEATVIHLGFVCGIVEFNDSVERAACWTAASADSFIDLHSLLPSYYENSSASGIWTDGQGTVRIVGSAQRGEPYYEQVAVMWTFMAGGCYTSSGCSLVWSQADCAGIYLGDGIMCSPNALCEAPISSPRWMEDCDGDLLVDSCAAISDDCNANGVSDACETLDVVAEQFNNNDAGSFNVNGFATINNNAAVLTPADNGLMGSIVRPPLSELPLSRMRAIFDFRLSDPSAVPAEGFSFALLNRDFHDQSATFGEDGPLDNSIAVKFNTYDNGEGEGDNSMEIRYNGDMIARRTVLPLRLADSLWHRAVIDLSAEGTLTVKLGTSPGDISTVFDAVQLPNYSPFVALVGFGARTGGFYAMQQVDNIRLGTSNQIDANADGSPDSCSCPADFNQDGGIDGADVESFFAAWVAADASADVNQDGGVDGADVESFFVVWSNGGC